MLTLTVVGCSGSASGPGSPASCYLVQATAGGAVYSLVLDLGPGAFGPLTRHVAAAEVDAIGFSHLHADHCGDFGSFHVAAHYGPGAPFRAELLGPAGTAARLGRMYEVDLADVDDFAARWPAREWQPEQRLGPLTVRTVRVRHPVEAYAVRVELAGRSLVYTGDTAWCEPLVELATGADVLLCEAGHPTGVAATPGVHLTPAEAAELARRAGVGTLVLTHVSPWFDAGAFRAEAEQLLGREVLLARPGVRLAVGGHR
ncbi:MBL fold metallo-hydrolase [Auraticoccus cholistanensis]|uniref:MBL fold metallo-hydrolase n=1 Tax=Auraticoccus cholistanensis TaxID=2656650 RepID=UPI0018D23050